MTRNALLIAATFLVASVAMVPVGHAQYFGRNKVQYDQFDFKVIGTDRFDVYFYDEESRAVQDAARMAERWYGRHSRTFLRDFVEKKPIIFYANDADFQQTNAIRGSIGEGTGGVTESLKERVIMPLTGLYSETDHVLGHELVHSFQYDIGLNRDDTTRFSLQLMPLWLIEGTAEYLSVGRDDAHTAMWLRDAALRDDLPTIDQLTRGVKYFPYRYGQAYMAYIGGKYGDAAVANIYKLGGRVGVDSAFVYTIGLKPDSLSREWIQAVKDTYLPLMEGRQSADSTARRLIDKDLDGGNLNIAPSVSPDGRWVAFLSERDLFNINLFIADAQTGQVVKKLKGTSSNPHFDSIRFIASAGSWSPDGRQFVFVTFVQGDNELSILDWQSGSIKRRIAVKDVSALSNPSWSPDGRRIAFSGLNGGISDLYVLDLESGEVSQITNDRYGDLQPTWSPDGKTIAFVSDRGPGGTNFSTLEYAPVRLSTIDLETREINTLIPFEGAKHTNPQFSPDGRSLYFISDQDGFKDIYRLALDTQALFRVTELQTGVSGITALSPAMSVAAQNGRMMFSVFSDNEYSVFSLEEDETRGIPIDVSERDEEEAMVARLLPPTDAVRSGLVSNYLSDPLTGLPDPQDYDVKDYGARLHLDYVAPPTVGVSAGGPFGTGVAGGIALFFSDMLGNHNLTVVAQANGTFRDIGGQVSYLNQKRRLNFGGSLAHIPYQIGSTFGGFLPDGSYQLQLLRQRIFIDRADILGSYPFTTTRRIDLSGGFVRYGFQSEVEIYTQSLFTFDRQKEKLPRCSVSAVFGCAPDPVYFFQTAASYIGDYSFFGFTSPVNGGRYRFQVGPFIGSETFVRVLADYRRYKFVKPITLAFRGMHLGNYFSNEDPNDPSIFTQEYLGYANSLSFVRGYSFTNVEPNECPVLTETGCSFDNLLGTRIALASAEVRVPLFGTRDLGLLNFPYVPTEVAFFADAGLAWTADEKPVFKFERRPTRRTPVVSAGVSTRFNLFGYLVLEMFYAVPFQRPEKGGHIGVQLVPGW